WNSDISIGEVVRAWREYRGLTPSELLARTSGAISKAYLFQLENDIIHRPSDKKLKAIAQALDVPPTYLITRQFPEMKEDKTKQAGARRRQSGALSSPPMGAGRGVHVPIEPATIGQTIDMML